MIKQEIIDYLLDRATDRDVRESVKKLDLSADEVFDGKFTMGDTTITECWFPDNTMCGLAESPTHGIIYFITKQSYAIFYSRPNKNIH